MNTRSGNVYTPKGKEPILPMTSQEEAMPSWVKVILEKVEALSLRIEEQSQRTSNLESKFSPQDPSPSKVNAKPIEFPPLETPNSIIRNNPQNEFHYNHVKVDVPMFQGSIDPKEYLNWESHLDSYFGWYDFSENRKIRFAEMKLNDPAKIYWKNAMHLLEIRRQDPIETWNEMKFKLREKYIPLNYHDKLVDQWQRICQGNKSALEYVTEFDELTMACG